MLSTRAPRWDGKGAEDGGAVHASRVPLPSRPPSSAASPSQTILFFLPKPLSASLPRHCTVYRAHLKPDRCEISNSYKHTPPGLIDGGGLPWAERSGVGVGGYATPGYLLGYPRLSGPASAPRLRSGNRQLELTRTHPLIRPPKPVPDHFQVRYARTSTVHICSQYFFRVIFLCNRL